MIDRNTEQELVQARALSERDETAGAAAGGLVGVRRAAANALGERSRDLNNAAIARIFTDPQAVPDLRALAKSAPGSKNAELFTHRLLTLANGGSSPLRQSASAR